MKTVVTITGIRPDFIRMSELFKKLDANFNHILVHTGQHYDKMLSEVFFNELKIRKPDYNLEIGGEGKEHFHQLGAVSVKIIELLRKEKINPDIILFLGDSNSVTSAVSLKKEGYVIGHIEAGMRSGDRRMLEEINRTVCDHCSDFHFVYHDDYKDNLVKEGLPAENIYVVGNTIVEVCNNLKANIIKKEKEKKFILMDIHRPENFKYRDRLENILKFVSDFAFCWGVPVKCLNFGRTMKEIQKCACDYEGIKFIDLMSYRDFLQAQYDCVFMLSDSGTAQEEPALLDTPVVVPRDFTERPQSVAAGCSIMMDVNEYDSAIVWDVANWVNGIHNMDVGWLGDGNTSQKIIDVLKEKL